MELKEKSGFKHSAPLYFSWNSIMLLALLFSIGIFLLSCKKDKSQYYVKYAIDSSTIYYGGKLNVDIKNESSDKISYTINQRELWEVTIGPVEKGFTANMKVTADGETHGHLKLFPSIYVSIDNGPFTLEKTDGSDNFRDEVELSYTIE